MNCFQVVLSVLAVLVALVTIRLILGPTVWDRLLALNMIFSKMTVAIVVLAILTGRSFYLDVALVYAVLGFVGMVLIARFIERRGDLD